MSTRKAAVAGSFYPRYKPDLLRILKESFTNQEFGPGKELEIQNKERTVLGGVSPHAGYTYSGCAAAFTYLNLFKEKIPDTVVVLGTDHIGYGKIASMKEGEWETPLGDLQIDSELTSLLLNANDGLIRDDDSAFMGYPFGREHNIEVQLPFIKYCAGEEMVKFVPIKIAVKDFNTLDKLSDLISESVNSLNKDIVILASSDMTHKQPQNPLKPSQDLKNMKKMDHAVIDAFKEFNPKKTLEKASQTTVCGAQTITTMMLTCKKLGATTTKALQYYKN